MSIQYPELCSYTTRASLLLTIGQAGRKARKPTTIQILTEPLQLQNPNKTLILIYMYHQCSHLSGYPQKDLPCLVRVLCSRVLYLHPCHRLATVRWSLMTHYLHSTLSAGVNVIDPSLFSLAENNCPFLFPSPACRHRCPLFPCSQPFRSGPSSLKTLPSVPRTLSKRKKKETSFSCCGHGFSPLNFPVSRYLPFPTPLSTIPIIHRLKSTAVLFVLP